MSVRKGGQLIAGSVDPDKYANISLTNSPYTTNRILEIPQDIKLELNNGTLTLKAGSKVYVPNGFEADGTTPKFDVVMIDTDKTATDSGQRTLIIGISTNGDIQFALEGETGSPVVSAYKYYYDSNANKCYVSTTGVYYQSTFPLCIATSGSNGFTSIDQVFNGFGYIGSTMFVLPGVKVQTPNSKNEDGSYKTFSVKTNSVTTASFPNTVIGGMNWYINNLGNAAYYGSNYIKFSENNLWESTDGQDYILKGVVVATSDVTSGVISNWKPCTVDSVVNSNASNFSQAGRSYLSGLGMPSNRYIDLTLGANGTTYTAPANGYFVISGKPTANGGFCILDTNNYQPSYMTTNDSGGYDRGFIPVRKGQVMTLRYGNYEIEADRFKFIYAEGETNV